jgi:hypothetical protein
MRRITEALLLAVVVCGVAQAAASDAPRWKVWLCGPHAKFDWCAVKLTTTVVHPDGSRTFANPSVPRNPPIDCFYVYPGVSNERRPNSDLRVTDDEALAALMQAGEFEQVCRVYAPMYHQITGYAGTPGIPEGSRDLEYHDVLAAWRDYLAHDNHGRGVVLLGHSRGSGLLEDLLRNRYAEVKKVLVSAILVGSGVPMVHDHFGAIPACRSMTQTGCIAGWSAWGHTPPKDARFERVSDPSQHILCVNPAAPAGGSAPVTPLFSKFSGYGIVAHPPKPAVKTIWISFPDLYTARCVEQGQRAWLLVTPIDHPGDTRERVTDTGRPLWGYHGADINLVLTETVALVRQQAKAYTASH